MRFECATEVHQHDPAVTFAAHHVGWLHIAVNQLDVMERRERTAELLAHHRCLTRAAVTVRFDFVLQVAALHQIGPDADRVIVHIGAVHHDYVLMLHLRQAPSLFQGAFDRARVGVRIERHQFERHFTRQVRVISAIDLGEPTFPDAFSNFECSPTGSHPRIPRLCDRGSDHMFALVGACDARDVLESVDPNGVAPRNRGATSANRPIRRPRCARRGRRVPRLDHAASASFPISLTREQVHAPPAPCSDPSAPPRLEPLPSDLTDGRGCSARGEHCFAGEDPPDHPAGASSSISFAKRTRPRATSIRAALGDDSDMASCTSAFDRPNSIVKTIASCCCSVRRSRAAS